MRSPIIRRSSSICASPGPPRAPMPPRWRSRWLQRRTRRVERYCSRASSTCSLPSWLRARSPKISRISIVRSATATPEVPLEVALLRRRQRLVEERRPRPGAAATSSFSSSALPEPTKNAGSGALRRATTRATATSPADSASSASSSSDGVEVLPVAEIDADEDGARRRAARPGLGAEVDAQGGSAGSACARVKIARRRPARSGSSPPGPARRWRSRACRPSG